MYDVNELQAQYDRLLAAGPAADEDEEQFADQLNDLYIAIGEIASEEQWLHRFD